MYIWNKIKNHFISTREKDVTIVPALAGSVSLSKKSWRTNYIGVSETHGVTLAGWEERKYHTWDVMNYLHWFTPWIQKRPWQQWLYWNTCWHHKSVFRIFRKILRTVSFIKYDILVWNNKHIEAASKFIHDSTNHILKRKYVRCNVYIIHDMYCYIYKLITCIFCIYVH